MCGWLKQNCDIESLRFDVYTLKVHVWLWKNDNEQMKAIDKDFI